MWGGGGRKHFESSQRKKTCHENKKYNTADFLLEIMEVRRKWNEFLFKCWGKRVNPEFYIQGKYFFKKMKMK